MFCGLSAPSENLRGPGFVLSRVQRCLFDGSVEPHRESDMEPSADGLVEIATDSANTAPAVVDETLDALATNGHLANGLAGEALDQHQLLQALQAMRIGNFS